MIREIVGHIAYEKLHNMDILSHKTTSGTDEASDSDRDSTRGIDSQECMSFILVHKNQGFDGGRNSSIIAQVSNPLFLDKFKNNFRYNHQSNITDENTTNMNTEQEIQKLKPRLSLIDIQRDEEAKLHDSQRNRHFSILGKSSFVGLKLTDVRRRSSRMDLSHSNGHDHEYTILHPKYDNNDKIIEEEFENTSNNINMNNKKTRRVSTLVSQRLQELKNKLSTYDSNNKPDISKLLTEEANAISQGQLVSIRLKEFNNNKNNDINNQNSSARNTLLDIDRQSIPKLVAIRLKEFANINNNTANNKDIRNSSIAPTFKNSSSTITNKINNQSIKGMLINLKQDIATDDSKANQINNDNNNTINNTPTKIKKKYNRNQSRKKCIIKCKHHNKIK